MSATFKPFYARFWRVDPTRSFRIKGFSRSGASVWLVGLASPVPLVCIEGWA